MGLFSIFRKSSPPDYETLLARLATEINEAKTHLSEIRLRERRVSLLINLYGISLWAIWVGLWWVNGLPLGLLGLSHHDTEGKVIGATGIAGAPIFIWGLNRLIHIWFARQRTHEETNLRLLLTKQRKHLEEIKKATNYDSTRKLIERYDDPSAVGNPQTPQRRIPDSPSPLPQGSGHGQTPASIGKGNKNVSGPASGPGGTPRAPGHFAGVGGTPGPNSNGPIIPVPQGLTPDQAAALSMQMHAIQPVLPTPEKRWYDRIADTILGEDPSHAAQSKYALVCGECFRHNGLIGSQYEWERMQWICPRCNHLNPPPISRNSSGESSILHNQPQIQQTPTKPIQPNPVQHQHHQQQRSSPRRRVNGDKSTPRSSRLGKEVFSASSSSDEDEPRDKSQEGMDVDES
ncbi:uncharacterized protein I206_103679 [Kwoniella pini CBS 10737]|uniref:Endoplasmic reticulum junction formation protein lunapark n=1 Tax=Kwoniella pini CBS 10737 TaxID=1296096 RepID=A0A1B9I953_9TREE|nr:uncharacterized protein I206_01321 [Kwoniella pini CBS 10737]OCF52037.1 hypothetical protein I206_01321 [Kwoniella pini CBS 10737]